MSGNKGDVDRLFRVLCARALQRHGKGFPSTEQEIEQFESDYVPSEAEKEAFAQLLPRILSHVRALIEGEDEGRTSARDTRLSRDLIRRQHEAPLAAAARGGKVEGLSPELTEKLERIVRESEEPGGEDHPEGCGDSKDEGREG